MSAPDSGKNGNRVFAKIAGAGAAFQAGASAVDSATMVATLVHHLSGSVLAVGAASAVLRLGWLLPQFVVGFLAQRAKHRMPFYVFGAFGRAACLSAIALLLWFSAAFSAATIVALFLVLWTLYAFVSGIVAVPYNDIVGRSIPARLRSRMLAWRFFGGGLLALGVAAIVHRLLEQWPLLSAYALVFALASALMMVSSVLFVSAGEPTVAIGPAAADADRTLKSFIRGGRETVRDDGRFRIFLYSQWLGGGTQMALPFYVVAATRLDIDPTDVALLLGAQTAGSLASNPVWGRIGDHLGKLRLLRSVAVLRLIPPIGVLLLLLIAPSQGVGLISFAALFTTIGALVNGMTISYLGYLMEISPDDRRPAYTAYFNALASPASLLPLLGAGLVQILSIEAVFVAALAAGMAQFALLRRLDRPEFQAG